MSNIINILVALDTDRVKRDFPNPSQDSKAPTSIGHDYGYMVASGIPPAKPGQSPSITGQGTGDLGFDALVGDTLRVFGASGSDNFEDAILLYGMPRFGGDQVMSDFEFKSFTKSAIVPPLPAQPAPVAQQFWFLEADVNLAGREQYSVQFGLYPRGDTGKQALYGYFQWDPTIQVAG